MEAGKAVIFLSDSRTTTQNDIYRSHHTLSENSERNKSFFNLAIFNDETLAAGAAITHRILPGYVAFVIPMVNDVIVNKERISPGQLYLSGSNISISNPYEYDLVNFLYVELLLKENGGRVVDFDLDSNRNDCITAIDGSGILIGKFDGRMDRTLFIPDYAKGVFVFAVEGSFEVQGRSLHPRDGLAIWDVRELEIEALSADAIVLLIYCSESDL